MNQFTYEIVSDGPHRPEQIFLVAGGALGVSGQISFGHPPHTSEKTDLLPAEELPPLEFVFQTNTQEEQP